MLFLTVSKHQVDFDCEGWHQDRCNLKEVCLCCCCMELFECYEYSGLHCYGFDMERFELYEHSDLHCYGYDVGHFGCYLHLDLHYCGYDMGHFVCH